MSSRDRKNPKKVILMAYVGVDTFEAAVSQLLTQQRQPFHRLRKVKIRITIIVNMHLLSFKL